MSLTPASGPRLTRRGLLASSAVAGLVLLVSGCTSSSADPQDAVTDQQADALSAQVAVQEGLVAAYRAATAASAPLATTAAEPSTQASEQLTRLRAASPGSSSSRGAGSAHGSAASSAPAGPPAGQDPTAWLVTQITAAADSHAVACAAQKGARAALLGSIAAGLRGQAAVLR
jgi:hypothetical protein